MRISTRAHGLLDFGLGALLVVGPWMMGIGQTRAGLTALGVGLAVIVNTMLTDFEVGRVRRLGIPVHLWIDGLLGLFLGLSPWLLEFDRTAWIPHVAVGLLLVVAALLTETVPGYDRRGSRPSTAG